MVSVGERGQVYEWSSTAPPQSHVYVRPAIDALISSRAWPEKARVLDFGCGNGATAHWLKERGFDVVGLDPSETGIARATEAFPGPKFSTDLSAENMRRLGPFDLALCIEVIAHCHEPARELAKIFNALKPGGTLILATPYYGYLKILLLALADRLKERQSVSAYAAYVSLFTPDTIGRLLREAGFEDVEIVRIGRVPMLAKDMIVNARKP
jgi:2-polyprenyl-6-hydroxyphenyl methylase/3-demethylubiquinone-9 3-methyltransferase